MTINRNEKGDFDYYAWPGGYPIFYLCEDNGILCPKCANENKEVYLSSDDKTPEEKENRCPDPQWHIISGDIHYEGDPLICDHCCGGIESAYGSIEGDQP